MNLAIVVEQASPEPDALLTAVLALRLIVRLRRQARPPLPESATRRRRPAGGRMFDKPAQQVEAAGYVHIGLGCFTPPDNRLARADRQQELRCDLLGYTTRAESDIVGLGVGALEPYRQLPEPELRDLPSWEDATTTAACRSGAGCS